MHRVKVIYKHASGTSTTFLMVRGTSESAVKHALFEQIKREAEIVDWELLN